MVKVCDAFVGSGKTTAMIAYINKHPDKKYLYVVQYQHEVDRILKECSCTNFVRPVKTDGNSQFRVGKHLLKLIGEGKNIVCTNQSMTYYTPHTVCTLKEHGYTLIIDEPAPAIKEINNKKYDADLNMLLEYGYATKLEDGSYCATDKEYGGGKLDGTIETLKTERMIKLNPSADRYSHIMVYDPRLLTEVPEVIVLTYLFKESELDLFMQLHNIDYELITVDDLCEGVYCPMNQRLRDLIHIESEPKINAIGELRSSLSENWYKSRHNDSKDICRVKNNITNYFRYKAEKRPASERMCGTYKSTWDALKHKGYISSGVVFNQSSTNEYRDKRVLAYVVNVFPNSVIANYYRSKGLEFNSDHYALSIMIQWIWRSAIRDGKEIWIYIPSKRMRNLLQDWLKSFDMEYKL